MWYVAGTGGFNPQLPDFYQHQDWVPGARNGWEAGGGWCEFTAYADVFYDLTTQGYNKLFATDPTTNPWYKSIYGASNKSADVKTSDIFKLAQGGALRGRVQTYLNATANNPANYKPPAVQPAPLLSNSYRTTAAGDVSYTIAQNGKRVSTKMSIFDFSNYMIKDFGSEILYRLGRGTADVSAKAFNARGQGPWWAVPSNGFHYVAVAGIDVKNSTVFVADPDSNMGSGQNFAGWPKTNPNFPGAPPANPPNGSFGLMTPANAALPVPAKPAIGNPASYDAFYAGFTFSKRSITSTDAPQYDNTVVTSVNAVYPKAVRGEVGAMIGPGKEETAITVAMSPLSNTVNGIFVEPGAKVLDLATNSSLFSLSIAGDPTSIWTDTESATDPFGNALPDDGVLYDLSTGAGLSPGETATIGIGTTADFSFAGDDVLFHFLGDPANVWLPEMDGGTLFDPSDFASDQPVPAGVPEPSGFGPLILGGWLAVMGVVRFRKNRAVASRVARRPEPAAA